MRYTQDAAWVVKQHMVGAEPALHLTAEFATPATLSTKDPLQLNGLTTYPQTSHLIHLSDRMKDGSGSSRVWHDPDHQRPGLFTQNCTDSMRKPGVPAPGAMAVAHQHSLQLTPIGRLGMPLSAGALCRRPYASMALSSSQQPQPHQHEHDPHGMYTPHGVQTKASAKTSSPPRQRQSTVLQAPKHSRAWCPTAAPASAGPLPARRGAPRIHPVTSSAFVKQAAPVVAVPTHNPQHQHQYQGAEHNKPLQLLDMNKAPAPSGHHHLLQQDLLPCGSPLDAMHAATARDTHAVKQLLQGLQAPRHLTQEQVHSHVEVMRAAMSMHQRPLHLPLDAVWRNAVDQPGSTVHGHARHATGGGGSSRSSWNSDDLAALLQPLQLKVVAHTPAVCARGGPTASGSTSVSMPCAPGTMPAKRRVQWQVATAVSDGTASSESMQPAAPGHMQGAAAHYPAYSHSHISEWGPAQSVPASSQGAKAAVRAALPEHQTPTTTWTSSRLTAQGTPPHLTPSAIFAPHAPLPHITPNFHLEQPSSLPVHGSGKQTASIHENGIQTGRQQPEPRYSSFDAAATAAARCLLQYAMEAASSPETALAVTRLLDGSSSSGAATSPDMPEQEYCHSHGPVHDARALKAFAGVSCEPGVAAGGTEQAQQRSMHEQAAGNDGIDDGIRVQESYQQHWRSQQHSSAQAGLMHHRHQCIQVLFQADAWPSFPISNAPAGPPRPFMQDADAEEAEFLHALIGMVGKEDGARSLSHNHHQSAHMAVSAAYGAAAADWTRQPEQELGQGIDAQAGAPKMRANDVHALGLDGLIGGLKQPMMQAYSTAHTPGTERDQVLLHRMVSWQNARQREKQALVFRSWRRRAYAWHLLRCALKRRAARTLLRCMGAWHDLALSLQMHCLSHAAWYQVQSLCRRALRAWLMVWAREGAACMLSMRMQMRMLRRCLLAWMHEAVHSSRRSPAAHALPAYPARGHGPGMEGMGVGPASADPLAQLYPRLLEQQFGNSPSRDRSRSPSSSPSSSRSMPSSSMLSGHVPAPAATPSLPRLPVQHNAHMGISMHKQGQQQQVFTQLSAPQQQTEGPPSHGGWHLATQAHKLSLLQRGWMAWVDMLATAMQERELQAHRKAAMHVHLLHDASLEAAAAALAIHRYTAPYMVAWRDTARHMGQIVRHYPRSLAARALAAWRAAAIAAVALAAGQRPAWGHPRVAMDMRDLCSTLLHQIHDLKHSPAWPALTVCHALATERAPPPMQQHLTQQPGQEQKAYPQGSATSGDAGLAKALSPAQEELPVMIKHGPMHGLLNAHQFCCPAEAFGSVACSEGTSSSPTLSIDSVIHTDDERRDVALLAVTESSSPLFTFSPTPAPTEPVAMATPPLPEDSVGSEWGELQRVADVRSSGELLALLEADLAWYSNRLTNPSMRGTASMQPQPEGHPGGAQQDSMHALDASPASSMQEGTDGRAGSELCSIPEALSSGSISMNSLSINSKCEAGARPIISNKRALTMPGAAAADVPAPAAEAESAVLAPSRYAALGITPLALFQGEGAESGTGTSSTQVSPMQPITSTASGAAETAAADAAGQLREGVHVHDMADAADEEGLYRMKLGSPEYPAHTLGLSRETPQDSSAWAGHAAMAVSQTLGAMRPQPEDACAEPLDEGVSDPWVVAQHVHMPDRNSNDDHVHAGLVCGGHGLYDGRNSSMHEATAPSQHADEGGDADGEYLAEYDPADPWVASPVDSEAEPWGYKRYSLLGPAVAAAAGCGSSSMLVHVKLLGRVGGAAADQPAESPGLGLGASQAVQEEMQPQAYGIEPTFDESEHNEAGLGSVGGAAISMDQLQVLCNPLYNAPDEDAKCAWPAAHGEAATQATGHSPAASRAVASDLSQGSSDGDALTALESALLNQLQQDLREKGLLPFAPVSQSGGMTYGSALAAGMDLHGSSMTLQGGNSGGSSAWGSSAGGTSMDGGSMHGSEGGSMHSACHPALQGLPAAVVVAKSRGMQSGFEAPAGVGLGSSGADWPQVQYLQPLHALAGQAPAAVRDGPDMQLKHHQAPVAPSSEHADSADQVPAKRLQHHHRQAHPAAAVGASDLAAQSFLSPAAERPLPEAADTPSTLLQSLSEILAMQIDADAEVD